MGLFGGNKESYKDKKSLVIYFSRADENYAVGYIDKGNTEYIAEYVRDYVGADMFKVEPLVPYSKEYEISIKEAKDRIPVSPMVFRDFNFGKFNLSLYEEKNDIIDI